MSSLSRLNPFARRSSTEPDSQSHAARPGVALLYAARAVRGFGDGFAILVLPAYLAAVGFGPVQIGMVATAALLGSALTTIAIGFLAPRRDLRDLLLLGAFLMCASGVVIASFENIAIIVIAVFVGTINPSSSDAGMLVALEHASLAHGVSDNNRTHAFARYNLVGALAIASGTLAAAIPDFLVTASFDRVKAPRIMFWLYAALGAAGFGLYWCLPRIRPDASAAPPSTLGPSRGIVFKLAALFSLDSFAGGFIVQSLLALWLFERFDLSLSAASLFFFWSNVLTAFSYPVAVRIAKRFGLVNTMVFTHIPSSLCLIAAAFSPNLSVALGLLLVRSALSQMDVPTRTSYVMAVVTPAERPAAASFTAVPRGLASSLSPALAGVLLTNPFSGLPLVICGCLKIVYDVALLLTFRHIKPPEERQPDA
jgi:MFS family permease